MPQDIWHVEDAPPPQIKAVIGCVVIRMWIMPSSATLCVELIRRDSQRMFMMVEPIAAPEGKAAALKIELGEIMPGANFDELTNNFPPPAELRRYFGQKFTGLDGTIVQFGRIGVMVEMGGVSLVNQRSFN
jgi:hypothetical protein